MAAVQAKFASAVCHERGSAAILWNFRASDMSFVPQQLKLKYTVRLKRRKYGLASLGKMIEVSSRLIWLASVVGCLQDSSFGSCPVGSCETRSNHSFLLDLSTDSLYSLWLLMIPLGSV